MNYKNLSLGMFLLFAFAMNAESTNIKHIFIDINTIIKPNQTVTSQIVGIINSMKYTAAVGRIPSRADFFKALKNVPALCEQQTYNEDLLMPAILCDWLLGLQSHHTIRSTITQHLNSSNLMDIERTIFKNISYMMMSPSTFIDAQYVIKDIAKILQKLKKAGYKIYIIGNWDKESEIYLLQLLNHNHIVDTRHCYFSHKAKQLKPNPAYYEQLLEYFKVAKEESLIIDIEKTHAYASRALGLHTILLHAPNPMQLKSELTRIGIKI